MLCRLCLLDSTEVLKIFENDGERFEIADIIAQHFWFSPTRDDPISNLICCTCWSKVDNFHQFYSFVQDAQKKLSEISIIKLDPTTTQQANSSFKKEEEYDDQWMNDSGTAEYVNVIEENITEDIQNYKIENESKESEEFEYDYDDDDDDDDDEEEEEEDDSKPDKNEEIKNPIDTDNTNQSNEVDIKVKATTTSSDDISNTYPKKKSSLSTKSATTTKTGGKRKRGRPKKRPPNASDSEEDLPLTHFVKPKKRNRNEQSEWLKKSKEDDEKIAKYMKLKCEICCEEFTTFAQVKQHYRTSHNKKGYVVCCNKKLYKRILLLDHVNKHINPDYFKCDECNKIFSDKQCLKNHMLRHESDESKIFQCDQCPRKYAKQYLLDQHKFIHVPPEERQFICDDCGKAFSTKNLLQTHRRYVHQNAYGKMCHVCAKVIRGRTMFEKHQLEHAGIVEPKVQCKKCGAWLKHKYSLRKHMRRHMESLSTHKCEICGKVAPSRGALRSHMRYVHEAERQYQCGVCDKAFKKAITLKEHMTTHTGEVLYTCPHCPKTFNSSANLHSHRKKVHRKEWEESRRVRGLPANQITSDVRSRIHKKNGNELVIENSKEEEVEEEEEEEFYEEEIIENDSYEILEDDEKETPHHHEDENINHEQNQFLFVLDTTENLIYRKVTN